MVPPAFLRGLTVALGIGTRPDSLGTKHHARGKKRPKNPETGTEHVERNDCKIRL